MKKFTKNLTIAGLTTLLSSCCVANSGLVDRVKKEENSNKSDEERIYYIKGVKVKLYIKKDGEYVPYPDELLDPFTGKIYKTDKPIFR